MKLSSAPPILKHGGWEGLNAYGQPDHKMIVFLFYALPRSVCRNDKNLKSKQCLLKKGRKKLATSPLVLLFVTVASNLRVQIFGTSDFENAI